MGSSRSFAVLAEVRADEQEWVDAELVEQVELLEAKVASLETELSVAQSWVKELALWLDEAQMRTGGKALPAVPADELVGIRSSPDTTRLLEEIEATPIAWGRLVVLAGLVLAPWAVLGSLIYLVWPLAS